MCHIVTDMSRDALQGIDGLGKGWTCAMSTFIRDTFLKLTLSSPHAIREAEAVQEGGLD